MIRFTMLAGVAAMLAVGAVPPAALAQSDLAAQSLIDRLKPAANFGHPRHPNPGKRCAGGSVAGRARSDLGRPGRRALARPPGVAGPGASGCHPPGRRSAARHAGGP